MIGSTIGGMFGASRADSRSARQACGDLCAPVVGAASLPLHSPGKGANKPPFEFIASDLPQAGREPVCGDVRPVVQAKSWPERRSGRNERKTGRWEKVTGTTSGPAPLNQPLPPHSLISDSKIRIGETSQA